MIDTRTRLYCYNPKRQVKEYLNFPTSQEDLKKFFHAVELNKDTIVDFDSLIDINFPIDNYDSLMRVSKIVEILEDMDDYNYDVVHACVQTMLHQDLDTWEYAISVVENGNFVFYPNIKDEWDYGNYIVNELYDIPINIQSYIDMDALGKDCANGDFTSYGYIELF